MTKKKYRCRACNCLDNYKLEIKKLKAQKKELLCRNRQLELENRELKGLVFKSDNRQKAEKVSEQIPKKRGAPFGHKGRTRTKPSHIDEEIDVIVNKCPYCGSEELTKCKNHDDHIQEDIIMPTVKVTLYRHHYYYCRHCKNTSKGTGKDEIPGNYIGPVAKGIANYLHYKSGLSYGKIEDYFEKFFNMNVKKSSIYGFDSQVSNKGRGIYDEIKKSLKDTKYLHVDETGWPNDGKNFWLWCIANKDLIYYHIDKNRNSKVVIENLGNDYKGTLLSDFFSTYNKLADIYIQQKCLVHLLRMNKRLWDRFPNSSRVKIFCRKLENLTKKIIETNKNFNKIDKVQFIELKGYIKSQLKSLLSVSLPYPIADKFRKKLYNRQHELTLCLEHPEIPAHNNFVERQIRPNVILRKITFGTRSISGMENHQTIMSLIQTAASNNYPVLDLLKGIHAGQNIHLPQLLNHSP